MPSNFYMFFIVALVPLLIGFVYYHDKVAGAAWMKTNNFTKEYLQGGNMLLIFLLVYLFSLFISFILPTVVIHQSGVYSLFANDMGDTASQGYQDFTSIISAYGDRHRSFGHGAFHGALLSVMLILPVIAIVSMFERRGWKYILIHFFYWLITISLMGGILCQTLNYSLPS